LVRLLLPNTDRSSSLITTRSLAKSVGVDVRNPKWTSYGALEIDVFSPSRADFDVFLSVISPLAGLEFVHDLNLAPPHKTDLEIVAEARGLFNGERYWECHEVLEGLWRQKHGEEKRFLQGVILVCAAFVHHQKDQDDVGLGILKRAAPLLKHPDPKYKGLDVIAMERNVSAVLASRDFLSFRV
jgi:uncharacterized protein